MEGYRRYIDWKPVRGNSKITQIYSGGLEYALLSNEFRQCHQFVWCKDFLHDVIFAAIHYLRFTIYKFKYNAGIDPLPCLDRTRLLLANPRDRKFGQKIPACLDFINQIEKKLKIKKSIARECWLPPEPYDNGVFMIEGSKRWLHAPPMLSLYTLLLRVGFCHTKGERFYKTLEKLENKEVKPYQKRDAVWMGAARPALDKIRRVGDRRIFFRDIQLNYPRHLDMESIHNRLGILAFAADMAYTSIGEPVLVPYWHYLK